MLPYPLNVPVQNSIIRDIFCNISVWNPIAAVIFSGIQDRKQG
jgi:hypothetical protein